MNRDASVGIRQNLDTVQPEEAIGLAEKVMRLDPLHRNFFETEIGFAYSLLRQHADVSF
jgi:hypothetical protein